VPFLNFVSKTLKIKAIFYTHIWRSNLRQITKLHLITLKFDEVTAYYARSPPRIFHFHLKAHCTDIIAKYECLPNSPDFNHLTISVLGGMLQTFLKLNLKPKIILELKSVLQQIRDDLPQTFKISFECMCFVWW